MPYGSIGKVVYGPTKLGGLDVEAPSVAKGGSRERLDEAVSRHLIGVLDNSRARRKRDGDDGRIFVNIAYAPRGQYLWTFYLDNRLRQWPQLAVRSIPVYIA